jgi:tetratricopeptide (TPR) repeat protein
VSRAVRLCAACGAKNRSDWRACQRCRRDLRAVPPTVPARGRGAWAWVAVAGATGVVALAIALPSSRPVADTSLSRPPVVSSDEAAFDRPRAPATPVEVVLTPVTNEDFARAGESAYAQGQMGVALSAFESAVAAFPEDPDAHNNLGQLLVRIGHVTEALPHLEAASAAEPDRWTFRFNLARARGLSGNWAGAVADYQAAARIFPDDQVTLFNLGRAQQKLGQHAEAVTSLERAVALDPSQPSLLLTLAASYEKLSRLPEAVRTYRDFLAREPRAQDASAIRARIGRLEQVGVADSPAVTTSSNPPGA